MDFGLIIAATGVKDPWSARAAMARCEAEDHKPEDRQGARLGHGRGGDRNSSVRPDESVP